MCGMKQIEQIVFEWWGIYCQSEVDRGVENRYCLYMRFTTDHLWHMSNS